MEDVGLHDALETVRRTADIDELEPDRQTGDPPALARLDRELGLSAQLAVGRRPIVAAGREERRRREVSDRGLGADELLDLGDAERDLPAHAAGAGRAGGAPAVELGAGRGDEARVDVGHGAGSYARGEPAPHPFTPAIRAIRDSSRRD